MEIVEVLIHTHKISSSEIAVLSPYSAQKEEIKIQLTKRKVTGVAVKTITESQGKQEAPCIVMMITSEAITVFLHVDLF